MHVITDLREIALDRWTFLPVQVMPFGAPLPAAPGVYILFQPSRGAADAERGHGAILHVGQSDDLDETIGRGHADHGRFWSFVAAGASEVGFVLSEDAEERRHLLRAIAAWHRVPVPELPA